MGALHQPTIVNRLIFQEGSLGKGCHISEPLPQSWCSTQVASQNCIKFFHSGCSSDSPSICVYSLKAPFLGLALDLCRHSANGTFIGNTLTWIGCIAFFHMLYPATGKMNLHYSHLSSFTRAYCSIEMIGSCISSGEKYLWRE